MYLERGTAQPEATDQERRDAVQADARIMGHVVRCDGARATIAAYAEPGATSTHWTVGRLISINLDETRTVGLVYSVDKVEHSWQLEGAQPIEVAVELIGEVRDVAARPVFDRGITIYPHIGAIAHRIRVRDLEAVYDLGGRRSVRVGTLSQDEHIAACIAVDDTLNRHFAVVGTTGVGKSTAVSLLVRKTVTARPDLRVLILDPHNEYASIFGEQAVRIDPVTLDLPFWLFRLEEITEVFYRGREAVPEEIELLRDLIPLAKQQFRGAVQPVQLRRSNDSTITADTPVPYRMADLVRLIEDRMGLLDTKHERPFLRALRQRVESAMNDPRYRFMFNARLFEDQIHHTIGRIFRMPMDGRPITCMEMAGMPAEVVNSVCSVLARLAFDLAMWSNGKFKLLMLCEEAHRYMPADPRMGFEPTRHALARIAKEGRKYGCYLGVITQRPGDLDPTILSQCSTVFAMRLANERDQDIIRAAIADSSASTLSFLSSMGQREAIAFGEGVATTMRMKFEKLDRIFIPGSVEKAHGIGRIDPLDDGELDIVQLVGRLSNIPKSAEQIENPQGAPSSVGFASEGSMFGSDSVLRRPLSAAPEPVREPQDSSSLYGRRAYDSRFPPRS